MTEPCSNNVTKYNALLIGLQLAHEMGVRYLEAYGDSKLIVNRLKASMRSITKTWYLIIMRSSKWLIYLMAFTSVMCLDPRSLGPMTLAALATTLALPVETKYHLRVATRHLVCSKHMLRTKKIYNISTDLEPRDW